MLQDVEHKDQGIAFSGQEPIVEFTDIDTIAVRVVAANQSGAGFEPIDFSEDERSIAHWLAQTDRGKFVRPLAQGGGVKARASTAMKLRL
jgi:hypothetical protein